jgi:hypothetical protein
MWSDTAAYNGISDSTAKFVQLCIRIFFIAERWLKVMLMPHTTSELSLGLHSEICVP